MSIGTGFGGWIGDRLILPFARMFDKLGFDAPYQVPGLLMAVGALVGLGAACGMTRDEARHLGKQGARKVQRTVSRERRRALAESVMSRTSDLTRRLRTRSLVPEHPMSLRGDADSDASRKETLRGEPRTQPKKRTRKAKEAPAPKPVKRAATDGAAPDLDLLTAPKRPSRPMTAAELRAESDLLLGVLNDYGVQGEVLDAKQGPVVTLHELDPAAGTKAARVVGLSDDIARSMSALSARVAPVKGRSVIGIELPNEQRETVYLKEIMEPLVNHPTRCRSRWARGSMARFRLPASPRCRTCWSRVPRVPVSRWRSTR